MGGLSHITDSKRTEKKIEKKKKKQAKHLPDKRIYQQITFHRSAFPRFLIWEPSLLTLIKAKKIQRKKKSVEKKNSESRHEHGLQLPVSIHPGLYILITWTKPTRNPSLQPAL